MRNPSRFPDGGAVVQYRLDETTIDLVVRAAASAKAAPLAPAAVAPAVGPPVPPPRAVPPVAPAARAPLPAAAAPSPIAQAAAAPPVVRAGRRASPPVTAAPPPTAAAPPPAVPPAAARAHAKRKSKASVRRESRTANMSHLELLEWFVNDCEYGQVNLSQLTAAMSHLNATKKELVDTARAKLNGIKHAIDPGTDAIGVCRCLLVT